MFRGEYEEVREILYNHLGCDMFDADIDTIVDTGTELYEDLYGYYVNSGEMPYGTMKARDGDPVEWIADRLYDLKLIKDEAVNEDKHQGREDAHSHLEPWHGES